jgi:hypothetical protein
MALKPNSMPESGGASQTPRSISPPVLAFPRVCRWCYGTVPAVTTDASGAATSEEGIEVLQIQGGQSPPPQLCKFLAPRMPRPSPYRMRPRRGRGCVSCTVGGGRSSGPREWKRRARTSCREEEKIVPDRWVVGPQLMMVLVAKHPNLSMEFWSGVSSTEVRTISNTYTPNTSKEVCNLKRWLEA